MPTNTATKSLPALSTLRFARYSTYAGYLSGNRSQYTTKTHIIGAYDKFPRNGHYVAKTLCNKTYSNMETHDGNGLVEKLAEQVVTCKACLREIAKIRGMIVAPAAASI